MRRIAPFLLSFASLSAAASESTPPVDDATARRAEIAADAYLREAAARAPDEDTATRCTEAEKLAETAALLLEQGDTTRGGERFLAAQNKIAGLSAEQKRALGQRWRDLQRRMTQIAQRLLEAAPRPAAEPAPAPPTAAVEGAR